MKKRKYKFTIVCILVIYRPHLNPPAPVSSNKKENAFGRIQRICWRIHIETSTGYLSQKPLVFGQDVPSVLHGYVQSSPVELHHRHAKLKPAGAHALDTSADRLQTTQCLIFINVFLTPFTQELIKYRPTFDHKLGWGSSSSCWSSSSQSGSCRAANRGGWRDPSRLWWRLSGYWGHTQDKMLWPACCRSHVA